MPGGHSIASPVKLITTARISMTWLFHVARPVKFLGRNAEFRAVWVIGGTL
jgi:hypothetical protein